LRELELQDSITLLGNVDPQEMPAHLASADIFVNPSVVDNYPNSILEAFASGLPVVTTSAGGIPYLVRNDKNGLMVSPGDCRGMAEAMIQLGRDFQLCLRLAKGGKETAKKHSWLRIWPQLQKTYGYYPKWPRTLNPETANNKTR